LLAIIVFASRVEGKSKTIQYTYNDLFIQPRALQSVKTGVPSVISGGDGNTYLVASTLTLEPREYLKRLAPEIFSLANKIVIAESNWHPTAHNKTTSASGLFQFLDSTFQHYCIDKYHFTDTMADKDDPYIQIKCAVEMIKYEPNGLNHWLASADYWK
jgi:hypothetical protein